ncbi:MAG: DUF1330 domain-containing protein [Caulobacter sp.]|nr:DUF1330 domain-containing protein [Caulobacter sp.]
MSAYVIVLAAPRPEKADEAARYSHAVQPLLAAAGARPLLRGPVSETVSGAGGLATGMVLEFPDRAAASDFFTQDAYQALVGLRDESFALMEIHIVG